MINKSKKGVSLITLAITIVVIIILAAIAILNFGKNNIATKEAVFKNDMKSFYEQVGIATQTEFITNQDILNQRIEGKENIEKYSKELAKSKYIDSVVIKNGKLMIKKDHGFTEEQIIWAREIHILIEDLDDENEEIMTSYIKIKLTVDGVEYEASDEIPFTKNSIIAELSYDGVVPQGYEISYKLYKNGQDIDDIPFILETSVLIEENATIIACLYNKDSGEELENSVITKQITAIDKDEPTIPQELKLVSRTQNSIEVVASGSSDIGVSGFSRYQYSMQSNKGFTVNNKFTDLEPGTEYTIYTRAVDKVSNISEVYSDIFKTLGTYNIVYNSNTTDTVENIPSSQVKVEDNDEFTISDSVPKRDGYTFNGWTTSENSTEVLYKAGDYYKENSDVTLYAVWSLNAPRNVDISVENESINLFDEITTTFTANIGSGKNQTYQWYYNGVAIEGATSSTYSISTSEMTSNNYKGGIYKIVVSNAAGSIEDEEKQNVSMEISNAQQLVNFAKRVNEQHITFSDATVTQTASIDLSQIISNWNPIGVYIGENNYYFSGTYEGNYNQIKGLNITDTQGERGGMFSILENANVNNLSVYGSITNNVGKATGGLVGSMWGGTINNCHNHIVINSDINIGGIAGETDANATIENCTNSASITKTNSVVGHCGGIVGYCEGDINGSKNYGSISANNSGGIAGQLRATGTINNCSNHAGLNAFVNIGVADLIVGGITGRNRGEIYNSYNDTTGKIEVEHRISGVETNAGCIYIGGIAGANYNILEKSYNLADVSGKSYDNDPNTTGDIVCVAGIVGINYVDGMLATINNCYNVGYIYAYQENGYNSVDSAGIAARTTGLVSNCYNIGSIKVEHGENKNPNHAMATGISCIVEYANSSVVNCYYSTEKSSLGVKAVDTTNTVEATGISESNMKTQDFVNKLGISNWKIVSNSNGGFPVLSWQ